MVHALLEIHNQLKVKFIGYQLQPASQYRFYKVGSFLIFFMGKTTCTLMSLQAFSDCFLLFAFFFKTSKEQDVKVDVGEQANLEAAGMSAEPIEPVYASKSLGLNKEKQTGSNPAPVNFS